MNIYEIAAAQNVHVGKVRKILQAAKIPYTEPSGAASSLRYGLSRNHQLTAVQMLMLLEDARLFRALGKYETLARTQIFWLGDVQPDAAPPTVTAYIADAAGGDDQAATIIASWIKRVLPDRPVSHHWIAVRLLFNLPPNLRKAASTQLSLALRNVRNRPDFRDWWTTRPGPNNRRPSVYRRPTQQFDL